MRLPAVQQRRYVIWAQIEIQVSHEGGGDPVAYGDVPGPALVGAFHSYEEAEQALLELDSGAMPEGESSTGITWRKT